MSKRPPPHDYYPKPVVAAPLKPEIRAGLALVRSGKSLVAAAAEARVTEAALRSACLQANVPLNYTANADRIRRQRLAARDADICARFTQGQTIEAVAAATGAAAVTVARVLRRDLNVIVAFPKRTYRRRNSGPTVRQQRAQAAAADLAQRRARGENVSIIQVAREHGLDRDGVERAWRELNARAPLDDSGDVTDTNSERRRT